MRQTRFSRLIALCVSLTLVLQGIIPGLALAQQRKVEVTNHTLATDQTTIITNITIDGVDEPAAGSALDTSATVTTDDGSTWDIPVLWVRDDLHIDTDIADEGHAYLPALAFYVPQGYALEEDVFTVTLSDSLTKLFGTQETISVYDATTGITYILPASLRNLFARANTLSDSSRDAQYSNEDTAVQASEGALKTSESVAKAAENAAQEEEIVGYGGDRTIVEVYCAQTARDVFSDEDLQWLIELIVDYLEPQAVELLLDSFPDFRKAANNGEIGKEISLYVYYEKGDRDGKPEHENTISALALVNGDAAKIDGELKYCYMIGVDTSSLAKKDENGEPIRDAAMGLYTLIREGEALDTFNNTIVHETFHALMDDYNRTGMAGATRLQDMETDASGNFPTYELGQRYKALRYPRWFIEGTASAVENNYQFRYEDFQVFRRLPDQNNYVGAGELNPTFTPQLLLSNYLNSQYDTGKYHYFELPWCEGGTDNDGNAIDTRESRYVTGYLAALYLCELATRYNYDYAPNASSVQTVNGVTTVNADKLREGLNSLLRWMHEGSTLDSLIKALSPKDGSGQPLYTDTKTFEERFVCGIKDESSTYYPTSDSLLFVNDFLNYMLYLDNQLPEDEHPNGSILFDFDQRFTLPLDPDKKTSSQFLAIIDSNSMVPSTVKNDTANIGAGKSNPDTVGAEEQSQEAQASQEEPLPAAAKVEGAAAEENGTDKVVAGACDATDNASDAATSVEDAAGDAGDAAGDVADAGDAAAAEDAEVADTAEDGNTL